MHVIQYSEGQLKKLGSLLAVQKFSRNFQEHFSVQWFESFIVNSRVPFCSSYEREERRNEELLLGWAASTEWRVESGKLSDFVSASGPFQKRRHTCTAEDCSLRQLYISHWCVVPKEVKVWFIAAMYFTWEKVFDHLKHDKKSRPLKFQNILKIVQIWQI